MKIRHLVLLVVATAVLFGCKNSGDAKKIIATVNGKNITLKDFKDEINNRPAYIKEYALSEQGRNQLLSELINREVLLQEADKRGLSKDAKVLQAVAQEKEQMKTQIQEQIKTLQAGLKRIDKDAHDRAVFRELARQEVENKVKVSEEEARIYVAAHRADFRRPDGSAMTSKEAIPQAQNRLLQEKQQKRLTDWLNQLQKAAKMETHPELLKDVKF